MSNYIINFTDPLRSSFIIRPYTSNGPKFPSTSVLNDTSIAANSTLLLYGKGHPSYGERTDENLLHLLENFSGATEPVIKVAGMLWHKEVLYYYDTVGSTFYVAAPGSPAWSTITLFGSGPLPNPVSPPVGLVDGNYWFDSGSPAGLFQWSEDERSIDGWIERIYATGSGAPVGQPTKELQIYDGANWDVIPDLTAVGSILGTDFLRLDTSNGPLTGNVEVTKVDPTLTLSATGSPSNPYVLLDGEGAVVELNGNDPIVDLVGSDPTIRFRGGENWQVAGNDTNQTLEFRIGGTLGTNVHFEIDNANDYLTHGNDITATAYQSNITAGPDNTIPNKKFVVDLVSGAVVGDQFVDAGTFGITSSPPTGTIQMTYSTAGSPIGPSGTLIITGVDSDSIPFTSKTLGTDSLGGTAATVDIALQKAAPLNSPAFAGTVTVPTINASSGFTEAANKAYVDGEIYDAIDILQGTTDVSLRSVQQGGDTLFTLPFTYVAGSNKLQVYKNGIKQYKDELSSASAAFVPDLASTTTSLSGIQSYSIAAVSPHPGGSPAGTNTWTIQGNHVSDFAAGVKFQVFENTGVGSPNPANTTYTVVSATGTGGSPATFTEIVVAGGSPDGIPSDATPDGTIGIDYDFKLSVNGVVNVITPVNIGPFGASVGGLMDAMQVAADAVLGTDAVGFMLYDGNIRIESLVPVGSPPVTPNLVLNYGGGEYGGSPYSSETDLFSTTNLVVDGFSYFVSSSGAVWAYNESSVTVGSPISELYPSNASTGSSVAYVTFNESTLGTDVIEFLLV